MKKSLVMHVLYAARNIRSGALFNVLKQYCCGDVLDIGGYDFITMVTRHPAVQFTTWTTLERDPRHLPGIKDSRYRAVIGDGEHMSFSDASFDTVMNIQVLEHTFEPIRMVKEIARVLRPGGYAIFLIPQTGVLHHPPHHYYNFTRFWIDTAMRRAGLLMVERKPLGGRWTTTASHMVYFFLQSFKNVEYSTVEDKRNIFFFILWPLMALYALISIPVCMVLSLGDLTEEPNNWLVVARRD